MVESEPKKEISLMEQNIKTKGENAYYYAHKRIVDEREKSGKEEGITITGPGIITGGDPVLLDVKEGPVEAIKENKKFVKYLFIDNDDQAQVKIEFPDELKDLVSIEHCMVDFNAKSLNVKVEVPGKDPYFFVVKKLHKVIVPNDSHYKLSKNKDKLILNLKKKDQDAEWEKLTD